MDQNQSGGGLWANQTAWELEASWEGGGSDVAGGGQERVLAGVQGQHHVPTAGHQGLVTPGFQILEAGTVETPGAVGSWGRK